MATVSAGLPKAKRTPTSPSLLREIYKAHYQYFLDNAPALDNGVHIEIGSGNGFFAQCKPGVITSELWAQSGAQVQCSALALPFKTQSVACLYLLDVLHHLQTPGDFFSEAERTLLPGGAVLLIEPANTWFSRLVYQNFHHENFDPEAVDWNLPSGDPRLVANGALPWILLQRDRAEFARRFPSLSVEHMAPCMPFRYLVSGGLSGPQLLPTRSHPWLKWLEERLPKPWLAHLGMFYQIKITKKP